jgi:hypothetical protein
LTFTFVFGLWFVCTFLYQRFFDKGSGPSDWPQAFSLKNVIISRSRRYCVDSFSEAHKSHSFRGTEYQLSGLSAQRGSRDAPNNDRLSVLGKTQVRHVVQLADT